MTFPGKTSTALLLIALASPAHARIVCNREGDCWHTHDNWNIAPGLHLTVHSDDWRWADGAPYHWREHPGPGYWARNEWHVVH